MYRIYCDDVCIYDDIRPDVDSKVINPKLTMEENSAGQLSFQMPPGNIGYNLVKRMDSLITVYLEDEVIWEGRVISEDEDYFNQRNVVCEGALAFLNDTIQPPAEYHNISPRVFLERLIAIHNSKSDLQFTVGIVTVVDDDTTNSNDELYRYTNYESTLECIKDKLVDRLKGFLKIRKVNGVRYIDYLAEHSETNDQIIRFETNLLDFTRSWDLSDMATVIVPRGARLDENPPGYPSALEAYLTVESVNQGSIYVQNTQAVAAFGWICKVVDWSDVTVASNLLTKAQKYLQDEQFDQMTLELNAVDLHYLSKTNRPFKMYERIRCVSRPHGMDKLFPITKMEIQLDNPENTTYTLGSKEIPSLTARTAKVNLDVTKAIEDLPSKSEILRSAQENAKNMLMGVDGGYVKTIVNNNNQPEQIWIQNQMDDAQATQRWIWNLNGLGFVDKRNGQGNLDPAGTWQPSKAAMTIDGQIVADRITTGTMLATRIRGGVLYLGGSQQGAYKNGSLYIYNTSNNLIGSWTTSGIRILSGSINLGSGNFQVTDQGVVTIKSGSINLGSGNFQVTSGGALTMKSGSINLANNFVVNTSGQVTIKSGSISIGNAFSVNTSGVLNASGATISGSITATGGRIGTNANAWNIGEQSIYNGCSHINDGAAGTYVGINGIRNNDSNGHYAIIQNGSINSNNIIAQGGSIAGFSIYQNKLSVGDAEVSPYRMGCGYAGKGIAFIMGNSDNEDIRYGMLQLSNSGSLDDITCLDGIRILGNGAVQKWSGDGTHVIWEKWLGNIPDG